ncbi:hypothetical protein KJ742_05000 [Patescibacteria group bacterium]|nr:hypothetical protein [Patescibacteria group bacterium]MBU1683277.1 hypothetical protein [Patescibacteria group bacterium]MBU1935708.1 hypothetical protein [Patescibacteria group bacterium]
MAKKSSHWVTIPEETVHTPVSKTPKKSKQGPVKNKLFWGAGFVVLVIFTFALVAPNQMASLLQGNLFDQYEGLNIVPDDIADEGVTDTTETVPAETDTGEDALEGVVVEAETEAVSIQIEPVVTEGGEGEEGTSDLEAELDANRQLLEELSQQIAEFKEQGEATGEALEDLTAIVADEISEGDLRPAASDTAAAATTTLGQTTTGYRINTHTVTITPQEALLQNTAQYQAQLAAATTTADYSAQLSTVSTTPDSGPKESLLIALALAFVSLLGWRMLKIARA